MRKFMCGAACVALLASTQAQALKINLINTGGVEQGTAAYNGFRAAADFWQTFLTNDVQVNIQVGFTSAGFNNPEIIAQAGSARFTGFWVDDIYAALDANAGKSQLDQIALAKFAPRTTVNTIYSDADGNVIQTGAVSAITQKAKADGRGVVQNPRVPSTNFPAGNTLFGVETASNREWDNDGSRNNWDLSTNTSVLKALGYGDILKQSGFVGAADVDAAITFNSAFKFDLDPTNGIGIDQVDFVGTAIHELGHALGFSSGVDRYDAGTNSVTRFDNTPNMNVLDLFRYSIDPTSVAPGTGPVLDWSVGNASSRDAAGKLVYDVNNRPFFSFDGGTSNGLSAYGAGKGFFSTGANNGDGRQASHWLDTPYRALPGNTPDLQCLANVTPVVGVMDPTGAGCEESEVTGLDFAAFDAIGWNLSFDVLQNAQVRFRSRDAVLGTLSVPEPATWVQLMLGFGLVGTAARRRRRTVVAA